MRAAAAGRIVVTRNGRDFIELARPWSEENRPHAGILIVWGAQSTAFAEMVDSIHRCLVTRPDPDS